MFWLGGKNEGRREQKNDATDSLSLASSFFLFAFFVVLSASNSTPTLCTSRRDQPIEPVDSGTSNEEPVFVSSSVITTTLSLPSLSRQTEDISPQQVRFTFLPPPSLLPPPFHLLSRPPQPTPFFPSSSFSPSLFRTTLEPQTKLTSLSSFSSLHSTPAEDYTINLWDLGSSRLIKKMTGHTSTINSLAFSSESALLVSGSADCTVRVWDVKSAETEGTIVSLTGGAGTGAGVTKVGSGGAEGGGGGGGKDGGGGGEKEKVVPGPVVGGVGMEKGELPMGFGLGSEKKVGGGGEVTMRKGIMGGMERRW